MTYMQKDMKKTVNVKFQTLKRLGINANGSSMTDFHREIIFFYNFLFANLFLYGFYPQKNVLFLIYAFLGGCEDDLYLSSQQIDGSADTFITCKKTPH